MKHQPAYFAIIPANVRYADIPDRAKLLFGEITALAQKQGHCFASNSYFAEAYKCSPQAISKHIAALESAGFLKIEHNQSSGNLRKMWPIMNAVQHQPDVDTYQPQVETPINEKLSPYQPQVKQIKTSIKRQDIKEDIVVFDENDPPSLICQVVDYLNAVTGRKFEYDTRATVLNITARNKKGRTLDDFKAVIDFKAAEWMNDPEYFKHLNPETLFGNKMEKYLNAALAAPQAQPKANTDTALKDCDLPPDIAERYAAYMNHAQENYPALWASNTRVFSHCDYLDYWNDTSVPSLQFSLTAQEKRGVMLKVHEEINGNKFLRERYTTVHQAYLVAIRQAMKRETIKI